MMLNLFNSILYSVGQICYCANLVALLKPNFRATVLPSCGSRPVHCSRGAHKSTTSSNEQHLPESRVSFRDWQTSKQEI